MLTSFAIPQPSITKCQQGPGSQNVTIFAFAGNRHLTKNAKILQILGVTIAGPPGSATALQGGIDMNNAGTLGT